MGNQRHLDGQNCFLVVVKITDLLVLQDVLNEKLGLEAMTLVTHASYEINMQRELFLKG